MVLPFILWFAVGVIVYAYIGYPVIITLLASWRGKQNYNEEFVAEQAPSVTVLIPAHNEAKWIAHKIENTLKLDYPHDRLQILVASDGSSDETVALTEPYANRGVELNHHPVRVGKTATLNRVVPTCRGEVIVLTDCNALLPQNALRLLTPHFKDPSVGSVSGEKVCIQTNSVATQGEGLYWRYESAVKTAESWLGAALGGTGQVMAVRKDLFPAIPVIGDDFYVPMKILLSHGGKALFDPRVKAAIPAAASLSLELERKTRAHVSLLCDLLYLREGLYPWKNRIWWKFLSHHVLRLFVPFAMLLALAIACLLGGKGTYYPALAVGQALFYLAALIGYVLATRGVRIAPFYVPFYFVLANFAVLKSWGRWLCGREQYAWQRTERLLPTRHSEV